MRAREHPIMLADLIQEVKVKNKNASDTSYVSAFKTYSQTCYVHLANNLSR